MAAAAGGRSTGTLIALSLAAALLVAGLFGLGVWQLHRLVWKRDLIQQVESRIHANPTPAPPTASNNDAYRRLYATGYFVHEKATLVQALTVRGAGFWVMTPLVTKNGFTLLVNRGFIPQADAIYTQPKGPVHVIGLLRLTELKGGFLRANNPAAHRWYSRDVTAIGAAKKLPQPVANYFLDAEAGSNSQTLPIAGLTVVKFSNSHLSYAITWFVLAAMVAGAYIVFMRHEWKESRA